MNVQIPFNQQILIDYYVRSKVVVIQMKQNTCPILKELKYWGRKRHRNQQLNTGTQSLCENFWQHLELRLFGF